MLAIDILQIDSKPQVQNSILNRFSFVWKRLDHHMQEVVSGASTAFVLRLVVAGLAFGFNVLLAHMLGTKGAGLYFLALMVATIAATFGRVGLDNVILRHVAAGAAVGDWDEVKGVYRKGMSFALVASSVSALLMFAISPWLATAVFDKPELAEPLRWMSLAVVPMALVFLHAEALKGLKRITDSISVQSIGVLALSIAGLYLLGWTWGVVGAVWAYAVAVILMALAGAYRWRAVTRQLKDTAGRFETSRLMRSSMPLFSIALMQLVMMWTATFMLGVWGTSGEVGVFAVAGRTVMLMSLILVAVNMISAPKFAELYRKGDIEALGKTARTSARLMALMAAPVLLLFIFAPEWVMGLFGQGFKEGGTVLSILAAGEFVNVATGSVGYLLIMSGNERAQRSNVVFNMGVNLILCVVLIPRYGIMGAAMATALSLALRNLTAMVLVKRHLSIKMWARDYSTLTPEG